jgi:hypothetical protein
VFLTCENCRNSKTKWRLKKKRELAGDETSGDSSDDDDGWGKLKESRIKKMTDEQKARIRISNSTIITKLNIKYIHARLLDNKYIHWDTHLGDDDTIDVVHADSDDPAREWTVKIGDTYSYAKNGF